MNKSHSYWTPPIYGDVQITVDQFLSRSSENIIINFCVDKCERITYCNGNNVPALFTFLCGKKINLYKYFNNQESVTVSADTPLIFYFTDENNHKITENTPIIRCKLTYK